MNVFVGAVPSGRSKRLAVNERPGGSAVPTTGGKRVAMIEFPGRARPSKPENPRYRLSFSTWDAAAAKERTRPNEHPIAVRWQRAYLMPVAESHSLPGPPGQNRRRRRRFRPNNPPRKERWHQKVGCLYQACREGPRQSCTTVSCNLTKQATGFGEWR